MSWPFARNGNHKKRHAPESGHCVRWLLRPMACVLTREENSLAKSIYHESNQAKAPGPSKWICPHPKYESVLYSFPKQVSLEQHSLSWLRAIQVCKHVPVQCVRKNALDGKLNFAD